MSANEDYRRHAWTCAAVMVCSICFVGFVWVLAHYAFTEAIAKAAVEQVQYEALRAAAERD